MERLIVSVSGVRGVCPDVLSPQIAWEFGCAFSAMLGGRRRSVVVGRDTRPSGALLGDAVVKGVTAGGTDVIDLGVVTTPGVALMTRQLGADGGLVVTASHNPLPYNGLKFLQPTGAALTRTMASRLREIWENKQFALAKPRHLGKVRAETSAHERHIEAVTAVCDADAIASRRFKVVLDSINGAGSVVTPMLLERLGCQVVHINGEPTGQFAHTPEPTPANLSGLSEAVVQHEADVGFAQDPDADRLVIADQTGRVISEEYTLALAAQQVLRHRKGHIAANLSTSRMIDDVAASAGVQVVRAPTGEANVVEAMLRNDCIFGGEGNGGVIDPRVVPARDSLVGIALILSALCETGKTVGELVATIPSYHMLKTKLPCDSRLVGQVVSSVYEQFASRPQATAETTDGLRVDLPEGWFCIRGSNTEPIVRIIVEASDRNVAESLLAEVRGIAEQVVASA